MLQINQHKLAVLAITESWLNSEHLDAEIVKHFPTFDIIRADRLTSKAPNPAPQQATPLSSSSPVEEYLTIRGGCVLLAHPGLQLSSKLTYSNGNCELIIAEAKQLELYIIVVYRPSGKNFSLRKFQDVLNKIREHTSQNDRIILMGDFNFNPSVVNWENTNGIMHPVAQSGSSPEKQGFVALNTLSEDYAMEQMISFPTRKNNILDLVYTNAPDLLGDFQGSPLTS